MTEFEEQLRAGFDAINQQKPDALDVYMALYHDDVYFEDPMQRLYGKAALTEAMGRLIAHLRDIDFQVQSVRQVDNEVFFPWTLRFRWLVGPTVTIEAVSHLRLRDGLILYHRDYWDMLCSLADTSPVLGLAYRAVMRRML